MPRRVSKTIRRRDVKENRVFDGPVKKVRNSKKKRRNTKNLLRQIDNFEEVDDNLYEDEEY